MRERQARTQEFKAILARAKGGGLPPIGSGVGIISRLIHTPFINFINLIFT